MSTATTHWENSLLTTLLELARSWRLICGGTLVATLVAAGISMILPPTYTSRTVLLPPQPATGLLSSQLGALSTLAPLAGGAAGFKSPVDQYIGLLHSRTIADRLIEKLQLADYYGAKTREDARTTLATNTEISVGRKDGLLTIEVTDRDPKRAADIANNYIIELRKLSGSLAITEAQQRRTFFESQLEAVRVRLISAQRTLEKSGFSQGTLRAEPKAAAEQYASLQAQVQASEVRLQMLKTSLSDRAPEVIAQSSQLTSLRSRLRELEQSLKGNPGDDDYLTAYREFKYQETLFDLFARQFELAKADESREGTLIQVIDAAEVPERRTTPKRGRIVVMSALSSFILIIGFLLVRHQWRSGRSEGI